MLQRAKAQGFVHSITNLYDDSFAGPTAAAAAANASGSSYHQQPVCVDPTGLPYMEGDYWVGEAENILKEMVRKIPRHISSAHLCFLMFCCF
jgi:hypothetical protein